MAQVAFVIKLQCTYSSHTSMKGVTHKKIQIYSHWITRIEHYGSRHHISDIVFIKNPNTHRKYCSTSGIIRLSVHHTI